MVNDPEASLYRSLIGSVPSHNQRGSRLAQIPGMAPSLINLPAGCAFRTRCSQAIEACLETPAIRELGPGREVRCFNPVGADVRVAAGGVT